MVPPPRDGDEAETVKESRRRKSTAPSDQVSFGHDVEKILSTFNFLLLFR